MGLESNEIECICHRCKYRWQYRGNSKYIACCPRCKMTVYIPKMLRLLKEAQRNIRGNLDGQKKRTSLEAPASQYIWQQQMGWVQLTSEEEIKDSSSTVIARLPDNKWTTEKLIDDLQCNLAAVEQKVTNEAGQTLRVRKYQSQCRELARWIPIALPTPEYLIYASDLKPVVRQQLQKIHNLDTMRVILHQAVLRLFESVGFAYTYISIGRKLIVKLIED